MTTTQTRYRTFSQAERHLTPGKILGFDGQWWTIDTIATPHTPRSPEPPAAPLSSDEIALGWQHYSEATQ
jgi:hypothetical protein